MSPEVTAEIVTLRQKVMDGSATKEDMIRAVVLMRGDRARAADSSAASRSRRAGKPAAQIKSADEMLDELGDI